LNGHAASLKGQWIYCGAPHVIEYRPINVEEFAPDAILITDD
jgi:hypothetical protein